MRRALLGVVIELVDAPAAALAGALLEPLPAAPERSPAALTVRVEPSAHPVPDDPAARQILFHGTLRGFARDGVVRITDGASEVAVSADGRRLDARLHPSSIAEGAFAHVLLTVGLAVALRHHGLFHLHAAALVSPGGRPVLVAGAGGSGKTTLALALASAGFGWLGDDLAFLARRDGAPVIAGLPRAFHVAEATANAFPALAAHLGPRAPTGKRELDPRVAFPGAGRAEMAGGGAILLPELRGGAESRLEPLPPAEAFEALLQSSAMLFVDGLPGAAEQAALLGEWVRPACGWALPLGQDLLSSPGRVAAAVAVAIDGRGTAQK